MIDQTKALLALSRMMGKRILPQGDNLDWKDYVQFAFDYAWRYYKWDWSLRTAVIDLETDTHLPEDFDLGGFIKSIDNLERVTLIDYAAQATGTQSYALEFDTTTNTYKVLTKSGKGTLTFVYQTAPPSLSATTEAGELVAVPFPSAMTIGIGASIYAKQGENPTRANIDQEWDQFHHELDRHVGRIDTVTPRNTNLNLQDAHGTYTGDVR